MSDWLRTRRAERAERTKRAKAERRMNCMQVARVLQAYLDGETDEITARRVAAHVEDCRRCGLEAGTYREIKRSLARGEAPDAEAVARLRNFGDALAEGGGQEQEQEQEPGA